MNLAAVFEQQSADPVGQVSTARGRRPGFYDLARSGRSDPLLEPTLSESVPRGCYLRDRIGGRPGPGLRLAHIPLGVDTDRFRPAAPEERALQRQALGITDDEVAVLFVGRLSHHAKAHPFPMFHGLARAARETGRSVHLVLSGCAANPACTRPSSREPITSHREPG